MPAQGYDGGERRWEGDWRRLTIVVPNPAAGADWSVQVPGGEEWEVLGLAATLTASAAVASRSPDLRVRGADGAWLRLHPGQVCNANEVGNFALVLGGPTAAIANVDSRHWGGPSRLLVPRGQVIEAVTGAIQAADQWSAVRVEVKSRWVRGDPGDRELAAWQEAERARLAALPPLSV